MPTREGHPDGPLVLEVERFEHVSAGAERVLLRVDGRYGDRPGKRVIDAMLFVDDGLAVHRHGPLEDAEGDADSWLWRAAFDVPAAYLTDERTRFAIESQPGCLIDLPRPVELARGAALPITARAAHTARRYAAAIAVLVAVAATPGGIPASARTEVLRVHHADGSVVYLTRDGRQLAALPADAVIVDQQAPEPQPEPEPQPAPVQAPEPAPAASATSQQDSSTGKEQRQAQAHHEATTPREHTRRKHQPARHAGAGDHAASTQTQTGTGASQRDAQERGRHRRKHRRHHHDVVAPGGKGELQSMPELLAAPGSDDARLVPLADVGGDQPAKLPTTDFESLTTLAPDAAPTHGDATGPDLELPGKDTPPLIPIAPGDGPASTDGQAQGGSGHSAPAPRKHPHRHRHPNGGASAHPHRHSGPAPTRRIASSPSPVPAPGPNSFDSLPGPGRPGAVPDFVIDRFRVPPFLLSIYQAAGIQYGIRWEVLAAINEIETDYGRNLNVSSAGALGWMQFMPATWKMYGTDANKDGQRDPYNPVDAIFAAARYLKAAGGDHDVRRAIFAYNHAGWYVDSVMLRARLIAGYPADLVGSLTGLTEGRFPVAARARYRDASSTEKDPGVDVFSHEGAPVVAVNDGVVKKIGRSQSKGLYVVLQDVYGNQYTYSGLGSVAQLYPVPKDRAKHAANSDVGAAHDPAPSGPASSGAQRPGSAPAGHGKHSIRPATAAARVRVVTAKHRLFAHPQRPYPQRNGGFDQLLDMRSGRGFETYDSYFARPLGLNSRNATLRRLKKGSQVLGGTILGRVAAPPAGRSAKAAHLHFEIRPAGKGAPKIDPKPILDGWKLLESTAIYRAKGRNALYGDGNFSIGEAMLLPKSLLAKRVLSDPRIKIYPGGRQDIATGQIDRRVLVVLEFLAESGMHPTVSCLRSGHSLMTASGNVSEHSSGNAVDISAINGVPIAGHQGHGGVTEQAVRRLMQLQGTMEPHQIISLLDFGRNTLAMGDHADHIHVGFHPMFGENSKQGREAMSVLRPSQWSNLVQRLGQIQNPTVPTRPSRYAIPDRKHSGSR